jgi:hypothetical protein
MDLNGATGIVNHGFRPMSRIFRLALAKAGVTSEFRFGLQVTRLRHLLWCDRLTEAISV